MALFMLGEMLRRSRTLEGCSLQPRMMNPQCRCDTPFRCPVHDP